jgi:hypothetical protein
MSHWRDQIRAAARKPDNALSRAMREDVMKAWLEDRCYSVWPRQRHEIRMNEMRWHSAWIKAHFHIHQIREAIYGEGKGGRRATS